MTGKRPLPARRPLPRLNLIRHVKAGKLPSSPQALGIPALLPMVLRDRRGPGRRQGLGFTFMPGVRSWGVVGACWRSWVASRPAAQILRFRPWGGASGRRC